MIRYVLLIVTTVVTAIVCYNYYRCIFYSFLVHFTTARLPTPRADTVAAGGAAILIGGKRAIMVAGFIVARMARGAEADIGLIVGRIGDVLVVFIMT